jgi:hypothetical protein
MNEEQRIKELEQELVDLRNEFHNYVDQKRKEESQRLRTALMAAGGIILALGSFIWVEIIWPVIKAGRP